MVMFTEDGGYDIVESVERVPLDARLRPRHRGHPQLRRQRPRHPQLDLRVPRRGHQNILEFEDTFPDAQVVKLEQNYRSTQTILDVANAVIRNNRGRKPKSLWTELGQGDPIKVRELDDEHAEARYVTGEIERMVDEGVSRAEIAVFYRTNAQSRVLEDTLVRAEIAYQVIGGTKFYERAEIKDAIAYLTVLVNPQDVGAFTRVVNSPRRGIGQTSMSRVLAHSNTTGEPVWEPPRARARCPGLGTAAIKALRAVHGHHGRACASAPSTTRRSASCSRRCWRRPATWSRWRPSARSRRRGGSRTWRSWSRSRGSTTRRRRGRRSLEEFLQRIALVADADKRRDDEGLVTLMTLHNAKGLEFPIVFMIGMEEGVFPHSRALDEGTLEEERRLCYVGITRADARPVLDLRPPADAVRRARVRPPLALPGRDPRRADRRGSRGARLERRRGGRAGARVSSASAAPGSEAPAPSATASATRSCTPPSARAWSPASSRAGSSSSTSRRRQRPQARRRVRADHEAVSTPDALRSGGGAAQRLDVAHQPLLGHRRRVPEHLRSGQR